MKQASKMKPDSTSTPITSNLKEQLKSTRLGLNAVQAPSTPLSTQGPPLFARLTLYR